MKDSPKINKVKFAFDTNAQWKCERKYLKNDIFVRMKYLGAVMQYLFPCIAMNIEQFPYRRRRRKVRKI